MVEARNAGNYKFYTPQLLAKEEQQNRGFAEMQRKLVDMTKDVRYKQLREEKPQIDHNRMYRNSQNDSNRMERNSQMDQNRTDRNSQKEREVTRKSRWDQRGSGETSKATNENRFNDRDNSEKNRGDEARRDKVSDRSRNWVKPNLFSRNGRYQRDRSRSRNRNNH